MINFWKVYFLKCSDDSIYCGITTDLERRLSEHTKSRRGSKYTRSRRPVNLVWYIEVQTRSDASKLESSLKKLSKKKKEKIIELNADHDDIINIIKHT